MMNAVNLEQQGRRVLESYLGEAGIRVLEKRGGLKPRSEADLELEVKLPNGDRRRLLVEFKGNARRAPLEAALAQLRDFIAHAPQSRDILPVVFTRHLGRPLREWLKSQKVWFADLSGNRFFWGPGLHVDYVVSEKPVEVREPPPSVFADRSSRILRYLLPRPPQQVGIRDLARKLELSPAAVSGSVRKLREMGYLDDGSDEIRLLDREALLEEWVSFYRSRFRRQVQSRYYVQARSAEAIIKRLGAKPAARAGGYALSLHAGASLVAPFVQFREVHVYVAPDEEGVKSLLAGAVGGESSAQEANLVFLQPFYKGSFLFDARVIRRVRVVSDLQLYLDLSCFPQRGSEQAEVILERRLRPSWSGK
jgi:DNA-binding transcriptional ArsR family regulator